MPAPAVYVIAIVGTVGVAIAFKEFIYPHIAPRIDRWKAEFQAARQRRADAERMAEVPLIQRGAGKDDPEDDDDDSDEGFGKGNTTQRRAVMKNGLLVRRRTAPSDTIPSKSGHIELDDWNTGASTSTEMRSQPSDLRLRENNGSLGKSIQPIRPTPYSPTASTRCTPRSGGENSNQIKIDHKPVGLGLKKTIETHAFLDESIQAISYTPLSPIQTPTPTHVLYNSSSTRSPGDSPSSTSISPPLQSPSFSLRTATLANASVSSAESSLRSPPSLENKVSQTSNDPHNGATTASNSILPLLPLSSPTLPTPSSPLPQLLPPVGSQPSPYQTPPHVHAIPSLSQSYPLDDLLDYEHGLELLSPPSPLSRNDSPFEFAGLSPRPEGPMLLSARSGDVGKQFSAAPADSITNSTRSTTYLSFSSSPALSASSVFPTSENGYENDSNQSDFSSTFSSPFVAPTRLGDIGSESLPPHDHLGSLPPHDHLGSPLSSMSSPSFDYPHYQRRRRQQPERSIGVPVSPTPTTRSPGSDARRSIITFNDNHHADTQTLSPRDRARSPWTMMNVMATDSVAMTSTDIHPIEPAARSRQTTSQSEFGTGSELSDLDLLNMRTKDYEASSSPAGRSLGIGSHSALHAGSDGGSRAMGSSGGMRGPGIGDGNESDTSSWSLAGGSE